MAGAVQRRISVFPGSFYPLTLGHVGVIERAAALFDLVVLGVLDNPDKTNLFSSGERVSLLRTAVGNLDHVEVESFSGLAVDFAARVGARWIVRGVRSASDVAYELPMVHSNRLCGAEEIETILIPTRPDLAFISSSLVRQIAAARGKLDRFGPPDVERALREKFAG